MGRQIGHRNFQIISQSHFQVPCHPLYPWMSRSIFCFAKWLRTPNVLFRSLKRGCTEQENHELQQQFCYTMCCTTLVHIQRTTFVMWSGKVYTCIFFLFSCSLKICLAPWKRLKYLTLFESDLATILRCYSWKVYLDLMYVSIYNWYFL